MRNELTNKNGETNNSKSLTAFFIDLDTLESNVPKNFATGPGHTRTGSRLLSRSSPLTYLLDQGNRESY